MRARARECLRHDRTARIAGAEHFLFLDAVIVFDIGNELIEVSGIGCGVEQPLSLDDDVLLVICVYAKIVASVAEASIVRLLRMSFTFWPQPCHTTTSFCNPTPDAELGTCNQYVREPIVRIMRSPVTGVLPQPALGDATMAFCAPASTLGCVAKSAVGELTVTCAPAF